jgi:hypothetical protein
MLNDLKKSWRVFKNAPPGERFERLYEVRKDQKASRLVFLVLGLLLLVGGVILLAIPGPGLPLIAFGAALLAQQSLWLARLLDQLEPVLHRLAKKAQSFWKKAATPVRAAIVSGAALVAAAAVYGAYLAFLKE